jgi:hypothetical protein
MKSNLNDELQTLREEGKSQDEILYFLSLKGLSITDAIVATRNLYGIKLEEAKKLVASNRHWEKAHANSQLFVEKKDEDTETYLPTLETGVILIIIIGILPWSYYCMTSLGPALGIHFNLGLKRLALLIIIPPAFLIVFMLWLISLFRK